MPQNRKDDPNNEGPLYTSLKGNTRAKGLRDATHLDGENTVVTEPRATLSTARIFDRVGFNRTDLLRDRPEHALPTRHQDIIRAVQAVYGRVGRVRTVIDLMADFASEGLDIVSTDKREEAFLRTWARKVRLADRAHEFIRLLLRDGNVIVHRKFGKLSIGAARQWARAQETERVAKTKSPEQRRIPIAYTFLPPAQAEKIGGEVAAFFETPRVGIRLGSRLVRMIRKPGPEHREFVGRLPRNVIDAVKDGGRNSLVPLDPESTYTAHYKKNDWDAWAHPFLFSVLDDILFRDLMRAADQAALDGIISPIRLWRLGRIDRDIMPSPKAVNRLLDILRSNTGGGVKDIIWDDMIQLDAFYPPIDKILGEAKYKTVDADISRGLGIPDFLTGAGQAGNAQGAFVQLKTLTERLEYVRRKALDWLEAELELVGGAMRFGTRPVIAFGSMSLKDEAREKLLMIQLMDRGVVSVQQVLGAFGHDFMVELQRMRDEHSIRTGEEPILEHAGPFVSTRKSRGDRLHEQRLEVVELSQGLLADEGGANPDGDQPGRDEEGAGPGRPMDTPDGVPRDERTPVTLSAIAGGLMDEIDDLIDPRFLEDVGLSNMRKLTARQRVDLEECKFSLLASIRPGGSVESMKVDPARSSECRRIYQRLRRGFMDSSGREPAKAERGRLRAAAWVEVNG